MIRAKVFTATEARDKFFAILEMVADGEPVVIEQRQQGGKYSFTLELLEGDTVETLVMKFGPRKGRPRK